MDTVFKVFKKEKSRKEHDVTGDQHISNNKRVETNQLELFTYVPQSKTDKKNQYANRNQHSRM